MYIFIVSPSPRSLQLKGRSLPRVAHARGAEPFTLHPRAAPDPRARPNFAFCVVAFGSFFLLFVRTSPEAGSLIDERSRRATRAKEPCF